MMLTNFWRFDVKLISIAADALFLIHLNVYAAAVVVVLVVIIIIIIIVVVVIIVDI